VHSPSAGLAAIHILHYRANCLVDINHRLVKFLDKLSQLLFVLGSISIFRLLGSNYRVKHFDSRNQFIGQFLYTGDKLINFNSLFCNITKIWRV
jgi:hypothetical protein